MDEIIKVTPSDDYKLELVFSDNFKTIIDFKPFIKIGISEKLNDINYFRNVKIDEFGGITWNNGFDFCPNYLRAIAES